MIETLGKDDQLVEMELSSEARRKHPHLPTHFDVRAIRYQPKGYPPRILLTSLVDAKQYPAAELRALYHERWELELGFGELKTDMLQRLEAIRSRNPDAVNQELWGLLLAYNLVRLEMERIADETGVAPRRISFVAALRLIINEWSWSTITTSPGAIPRHLTDFATNPSLRPAGTTHRPRLSSSREDQDEQLRAQAPGEFLVEEPR